MSSRPTENLGRAQRRSRWYHSQRARRTPQRQDLRVAWVNVERSDKHQSVALQACYEKDIHVLHVQEPYWTCEGRTAKSHEGWEEFRPVDMWHDEATRPKVLTYVRKGLKTVALQPKQTRRDILWLRIGGVTFVNVYRTPGDEEGNEALDQILSMAPQGRMVVGGDFNAGHTLWQPGRASPARGGELAAWSGRAGMPFTGEPGKITHRYGNVLDLVFSNVPMAETDVDEDLYTGSDHHTLVTLLPGTLPELPMPTRWTVPVAAEEDFRAAVETELRGRSVPENLPPEEIEQWAQWLTDCLTHALKSAGSPVKDVGGPAIWWSEECAEARRAMVEAARGLPPGTPTPEAAKLRTVVRNAKRQYWHTVVDNMRTDKDLWKVVAWHKLSPKQFSPPLETPHGPAHTPLEKAKALVEMILQRFSAEDDLQDNPLHGWVGTEGREDLRFDDNVTLPEVTKHTVGVSSTSPGVDGITVNMLKCCWDLVGPILTGIYTACLRQRYFPTLWKRAEVAFSMKVGKKDRTSFRSYRPIALLSVLSKGLERILAKRMAWSALQAGILSPQHISALPKRAATDLLAAFTHDVEKELNKGRCSLLFTMDVQGAFDALLIKRFLRRCREQGWDIAWLKIMESFLTGRQVRGRLDGATTEFVGVTCGTPQGSPWSAIMYLLYLAELFLLHPELFGYADDLAGRVSERTPYECARKAAGIVRSILDWGDENRVVFAPEKCEAIHITRKRNRQNPSIRAREDYIIEPVELPTRGNAPGDAPVIRWLGLFVDRKFRFRAHAQRRAAKAQKVANHLLHLSKTVHGPPP